MQHLYALLGLTAVLLLLLLGNLWVWLRARARHPYRLDAVLLSPAQRVFLTQLERALGREYRVFARVAAAEIIEIDSRLDRRRRARAAERLEPHLFDFLICTRDTSTIVCAVKLEARAGWFRQPARRGLERLCAAVGLPILVFGEKEDASLTEIEARVFGAMNAMRVRHTRDEPSADEALAALRGLQHAMAADETGGRAAAPGNPIRRAFRSDRRPFTRTPLEAASKGASAASVRAEPRLGWDEELDLGPEVRIRVGEGASRRDVKRADDA